MGRFKSGQVHGWAMYTAVHCPKYNLNHCIKDDTFTAGTDATVLYIYFFRSSFVSVVGLHSALRFSTLLHDYPAAHQDPC